MRAKYYKNPLSYAVDSDLSNGWSYPSFEPLRARKINVMHGWYKSELVCQQFVEITCLLFKKQYCTPHSNGRFHKERVGNQIQIKFEKFTLTLKAPTFWKSSHLKCNALPAILSRLEHVITGVWCM